MREYIEDAMRTDLSSDQYLVAGSRLQEVVRLNHGLYGLITEAGELTDLIKRHVYYGSEIDPVELEKETGDVCWYLALVLDELNRTYGLDTDRILTTNINKLKARYPEKFTEKAALERKDMLEE